MEPSLWPSVVTGLAFGVISIAILRGRGLISRTDFAQQPPRRGALGLYDIFIAGGMFILVPPVVLMALNSLGRLPSQSDSQVEQGIAQLMIGQSGLLVAAVYLLSRVPVAVQGGMSGFGLGLGGIPRAVVHAPIALLAVFPIVIATSATVVGILSLGGHQPDLIAHQTLEVLVDDSQAAGWWILVGGAVLVAPVLEELLFRGLFQTGLQQCGLIRDRWTAIAITSVAFAFVHTSIASPHALPMLYVLSVGLGWAYERRGNLWTPILMHAMFNAGQIARAIAASKAMNELS